MLGSLLSRGEATHLVLLSLISGIRGDCGPPPKLKNAFRTPDVDAASFPINTEVIYKCLNGFYNVHGKLDVTTCLSDSQWTDIEDFCESTCPTPPGSKYAQPNPGEEIRTYYTTGTTVTYICHRGYERIPGISPVITCLQNNIWSEIPAFCKRKSCGDPGQPQHGRAVILTDLLYRGKINFICDEGYRLIGSPFTQCSVKSGTVKWNNEPPVCQSITCSYPPDITGGSHDGGTSTENFPYNSTVTYRCDHGFLLIGEASVHCTSKDKVKGIWSGPAPECKGDCGRPKAFPNAEVRGDTQQSYPVGTRLIYSCISGYEFPPGASRPIITCLDTSQWSEVSVTCQGKRCPVPNIENGRIVEESDLRLGAQITFACFEGYRLIGRNRARCVLRNNAVIWDSRIPTCQRIPCYPPPAIANGFHDGHDDAGYSYGSAVTYKCNQPYSLIGSKTLVCISKDQLDGEWSGPAPECKVVSCRTPDVPNGIMQTSYRPSYTYEDRVVFKCKPGFKLKNNRGDTSCGADSTWQPALPECILDAGPTDSSGGGVTNGTSSGPTIQPPVGSTVKPMDETTKTEIRYTEAPELPADEPGTSISVPVTVGAAVAGIAVVAIIVAALKYRARHKRQGKTVTGSATDESYTAVPHNTDILLAEKA